MHFSRWKDREFLPVKHIYRHLEAIRKNATRVALTNSDKFVVFSDLHMGNGSRKDDFRRNSELFKAALNHYETRQYTLFLNGDIEELQRFSYSEIRKYWNEIFTLFGKFKNRNAFYKTFGNHDLELSFHDKINREFEAREAFVLAHEKGEIFLFHGHQVSPFYFKYNQYLGWILKHLANPLRINNYSVAHNSRKQYRVEKKVYHYSAFKKIVSLIGHTHRPLFESLSKAERLKIQVENLCRKYAAETREKELKEIRKTIKSHKKELNKIFKKRKHQESTSQLYGTALHVPCLFNSGTAIGKRGITCLEIESNHIKLVHWFDEHLSDRYLHKRGYDPAIVNEKGHFRMLLDEESLDYIFARIHLLG